MKLIPRFSNYSVTKDGRVWSHNKKGWMHAMKTSFGHLRVNLYSKGTCETRTIHQLVLETYIGSRPKNKECRHLNGDKRDNRLANLCWGSHSENIQDAVRHGTYSRNMLGRCGGLHPASKLSDKDRQLVVDLYYNGARTIRELEKHFGVSYETIRRIVRNMSIIAV